jgi:hypothetical protein
MRRAIAGIAAAVLCLASQVLAEPPTQLPESPPLRIVAWYSVPPEQSTVERLRELAEAGFTDSISFYPSLTSARSALDAAQVVGLKLLVNPPELRSDPEGTVRELKKHPALAGYFLQDEPNMTQFAELAAWAKRIRAVDADHPCYVNLFPNTANNKNLLQAQTYDEYLERYVREVPDLPISFDFYPVMRTYLQASWYDNLELIADTSRETRRPFWAFALSVAFGDHPIATAPHLRLQVYSNLAYGAQVIQYFTYWTPPPAPLQGDDFHDGPIDLKGNRTPVYDELKRVNAELKTLSPVFTGSQVESVAHTGAKLPLGTQRYQPKWPVKELKAEAGAVVSHRTGPTRHYLMVVNRSFIEPLDLSIAFDPAVKVAAVTKDGRVERLTNDRYAAALPPGDVAILTWAPAATEQK